MTPEHLEAFMLMSVEKETLTKLDNEDIIDAVAAKSKELRRHLLS